MASIDCDDIPADDTARNPRAQAPYSLEPDVSVPDEPAPPAVVARPKALSVLKQENQSLRRQCERMAATRDHYIQLFEKYANFFDFSPSGYIILDPQGTIREANLTAAMMLNIPKLELVGRRLSDFIHGDDRRTFHEMKQISKRRADIQIAELTLVQHDGAPFTAQVQLQAFPDHKNPELEFRVAMVDMSEKVLASNSLSLLQNSTEIASRASSAEQLLRENVSRIKAYMDCDAVGIRVCDADGNFPYQAHQGFDSELVDQENQTALRDGIDCLCLGSILLPQRSVADPSPLTTGGAYYCNNTNRCYASAKSPTARRACNQCRSHGFQSVALVPIAIDGHVMGLIHVADANKDKVPLRMVEILESVALRIGLALQRFSIQAQLRNSNEALRHLSTNLLKAQEEEQRRLAMELHDQTGQDLNVLKLRLKAVQNRLRKDQSGLSQDCTHLLAFIDKIIEDVRRLAHGLNPSALEVLGLHAALVEMTREVARYSQLRVDAHIDPLKVVNDRTLQTGIFRIVQEALNNISKHADARQVRITATQGGEALDLAIEDDGKGFLLKNGELSTPPIHGMGLSAMRLRARMLGGRIAIVSHPGEGTRVNLRLPLKNPQDQPA